jgi:hypothetical protein
MVTGICPEWCSASYPLLKSERGSLTKNLPPCTLCSPGPETDWNFDWHHTGLWTTARRDFSHPWVVCDSSKTEWGGGVDRVMLRPDFWWKYVKMSFFDILSKVKKIQRHFCRNRYSFLDLVLKNVVENLTSNLARSTLTSPSTVRVNSSAWCSRMPQIFLLWGCTDVT